MRERCAPRLVPPAAAERPTLDLAALFKVLEPALDAVAEAIGDRIAERQAEHAGTSRPHLLDRRDLAAHLGVCVDIVDRLRREAAPISWSATRSVLNWTACSSGYGGANERAARPRDDHRERDPRVAQRAAEVSRLRPARRGGHQHPVALHHVRSAAARWRTRRIAGLDQRRRRPRVRDLAAGAQTEMNAPRQDFINSLKRELCRTVAHEMRGVALTLPREDVKPAGPHDYDVEQEVLSALLCDHTTAEALAPLESRHFYGTFNRELFSALATSPERDLQAITDALSLRGPVLGELETIRDATPFTGPVRLRQHVNTLMDRWRERELIRTMQVLDAELRLGTVTVDGARLRLREFFMGTCG